MKNGGTVDAKNMLIRSGTKQRRYYLSKLFETLPGFASSVLSLSPKGTISMVPKRRVISPFHLGEGHSSGEGITSFIRTIFK